MKAIGFRMGDHSFSVCPSPMRLRSDCKWRERVAVVGALGDDADGCSGQMDSAGLILRLYHTRDKASPASDLWWWWKAARDNHITA